MSFTELQRMRSQAAADPAPSVGPPDKPPQKPEPRQILKRRGYSPSEKAVIIAECDTKRVEDVAKEYGISKSLVYRWRARLKRKRTAKRPVMAVKLPAIKELPAPSGRGLASAQSSINRAQAELKNAFEQLDRIQSAFNRVFGRGD